MKMTLPGNGWHAMLLVSFQTSVLCQCHVVSWPLSAYFNNFDTFQVQSQFYTMLACQILSYFVYACIVLE